VKWYCNSTSKSVGVHLNKFGWPSETPNPLRVLIAPFIVWHVFHAIMIPTAFRSISHSPSPHLHFPPLSPPSSIRSSSRGPLAPTASSIALTPQFSRHSFPSHLYGLVFKFISPLYCPVINMPIRFVFLHFHLSPQFSSLASASQISEKFGSPVLRLHSMFNGRFSSDQPLSPSFIFRRESQVNLSVDSIKLRNVEALLSKLSGNRL
jgi:hypothetical protein